MFVLAWTIAPAGSVMYALTWILDLAWSVAYALTRKVALAKSLMYAHTWNMAPTWTMAQHDTMIRGAHKYEFYVNFEGSFFFQNSHKLCFPCAF